MPPVNGKPALYWSQQGEVACAEHIPYKGSDTWTWDRWARMTPRVLAEIARMDYPTMLTCHTCRAITRGSGRNA